MSNLSCKKIVLFFLILMSGCRPAFGQEFIENFSDETLPVLNEELRTILGRIAAEEGRITDISDLEGIATSTATSGNILVADGTDFRSVSVSGSCTMASSGALSCTDNNGLALVSTTTVASAETTGNIAITAGEKYKVIIHGSNVTNNRFLSLLFNGDDGESGTEYMYVVGGFIDAAHSDWTRTAGTSRILLEDSMVAGGPFEIDMTLVFADATLRSIIAYIDFMYADSGGGYSYKKFVGRYVDGSADITSFKLRAGTDAQSSTLSADVYTYKYQ